MKEKEAKNLVQFPVSNNILKPNVASKPSEYTTTAVTNKKQ